MYDLGENFIVTRGLDGCLFLYPKCEWNKIINKYTKNILRKLKTNILEGRSLSESLKISGEFFVENEKLGIYGS